MPGETNEITTEISQAALFDVLSDPRRLVTLQCLANGDDSVGVTELSQMVAEAMDEAECVDSPDALKRLQILLYHAHLPPLDEVGVVDFDSVDNRVALTPYGERLVAYLNRLEEPPI